MGSKIECPVCGHQNGSEQRFCGNCGHSLLKKCGSCGVENTPNFRFCGNCGESLEPVLEIRQPTEERRWATVLFADISGFTSASEQMDPEDVTAMMDRCMRKLGEVVEQFDGYVEKIVGDQIMALFGAPVAHEDDPERAVRAGLEMQGRAAELREEFGGLQLRVGINTGEVMFAPVGPDSARRFTVMGDSVNTASRLESAAPKGGVLVGEETFGAARRAIVFEEVEPFKAKNKKELVKAWLAIEPLGRPGERRGSAAPLVGREKELALLSSVWGRVLQEERTHLVTLLGPPGIGKSRLAEELIELAKSDSADIVRGRSLPYGGASGYGAFAQQIKQTAGIFENDDSETAAAKLSQTVEALVQEADAEDVTAHLSLLLGIAGGASADKTAIFFSARRFVEALARRSPSIFLFEDLHWSDPSLLDLIESLASKARGVPALFLCTARPELYDARPAWGGGLPAFTALPLEPLSESESATLAGHFASKISDFAHSLERLTEVAEGNPLFIEELISSVAERPAQSVSELPTTVRGIIAARLDSLPNASRKVILDASVVGKVFWRGALEVLSKNGNVKEGLDFLEARDFVRRKPVSRIQGDEEFTFRHMLTREVAYSTIPKAKRRDRHALVAGFLEETAGEAAGESASMLAHHFREAGESLRAATYLEMAAESAGRAWAKGEAIRLLEEALDLIPETEVERHRDLRFRIATLLEASGNFMGAVKEIEPLLPELEGDKKVRGLFVRARAAFWLADAEGAHKYSSEAMKLAEAVGDEDLRGPALSVGMLVTSMDGRLAEGLLLGSEALSMWQPGTRLAELSNVVSQIGLHHYWMGNHDQGADYGKRGYELGLETHSMDVALTSGAQYAMCIAGLGRHREAFEVFRELVALGRELELVPRLTGRILSMWAGAIREIHGIEESRNMNEEAMELGKRANFLNTQVQSATDILLLDLVSGDIGRVQTSLPSVLEDAKALKGWHEWLVGGRLADVSARLHLALGSYEEAVRAANNAIEKATAVGRAKYESSGRRLLAEALAGMKLFEEAATEAKHSLSVAQRIGHSCSIWEAADVLGRTLAATGDDEGSSVAIRTAREAIERGAEGLSDEHRARFLAAEPIREILARDSKGFEQLN